MKTANILTASVAFALASLLASVGCTSPATAVPGGTDNSADSANSAKKSSGDDDDDSTSSSTPAKGSTSTPAQTTTTNNSADGGTSTTTGANQCVSCQTSKSPKLAAEMACEAKCDPNATDDTCFQNCWTTNCGTADTNECTQAEDACDTPCTAQVQLCNACVSALDPKAGAFMTCDAACQDDTCDQKCETSSGCSSDSCQAALNSTSCDSACAGTD